MTRDFPAYAGAAENCKRFWFDILVQKDRVKYVFSSAVARHVVPVMEKYAAELVSIANLNAKVHLRRYSHIIGKIVRERQASSAQV